MRHGFKINVGFEENRKQIIIAVRYPSLHLQKRIYCLLKEIIQKYIQ